MTRLREWRAETVAITALTTSVHSLDLAPDATTGWTVQRVVGDLWFSYYAEGADARNTGVLWGIVLDPSAVSPLHTNVNSDPAAWLWWEHTVLSRTIAGATATELRYGFAHRHVDTQAMRLFGSADGLWLVFRRGAAGDAGNIVSVGGQMRTLQLLPDE